MTELKRICVFCGSSTGNEPDYVTVAQELGRRLAADGITLVYGGGGIGLMGALAGCAPRGRRRGDRRHPRRPLPQDGHEGLTDLVEVQSMHERKQLMYDLADAFIALPGGLGTLEELAEVLTWNQLGIPSKPVALLDVGGFWDGLVEWLTESVEAGFIRPEHAACRSGSSRTRMPSSTSSPPPRSPTSKWLDLDET